MTEKHQQDEPKAPRKEWAPELQEDFDRILSVGEECISSSELKGLLTAKGRGSGHLAGINLYDGFEPSGRMHIAQGVFKAMNVNKCTVDGTNSTFIFWVADWFALMNDKMGGDLEKIRVVGQYLIEVWKAAGMDLSHVEFKWASEAITKQAGTYWPQMLDIARRFNITRIKKCCQIMGRLEGSLTASQILYPLMQCADVFFLKADICQLGVDQRKVNMLAREYCEAAKIKNKPVILSHHMLYGLKAGQEKMSKSDPDSAVFMEDSPEDVRRKILNAYCPKKEEEREEKTDADGADDAGKESMHLVEEKIKNPCLDYIQHIIFSPPGATFSAGGQIYADYESVRSRFLAGGISEESLKHGLVDALNGLLEPVRSHFARDEHAKKLLALVQQYKKESASAETAVRRLDLSSAGKVAPGSHLVFAPTPNAAPTLQEAVDVLTMLRRAEGRPCVLFLSDWSARVCNACGADQKGITAYYKVLTTALACLDPDTMEKVQVVVQSDAILQDPSNYWISVINVGRHFMLNEVMGEDIRDADCAGLVIARLMRVADVAGVGPFSLALDEGDAVVKSMVEGFFPEKLAGVAMPRVSLLLATNVLLHQRESDAHRTENDEYYLLDDPKVHGKAKLKKAFCEPGNIVFCPPIALASIFAFGVESGATGELVIKRSPENGGDVVFTSRSALEASYAENALHPGDLKAAAISLTVDMLGKLASCIKDDPEATKASKTLKTLAKKLAKGKSKK